jgi:hypothetical protein
MAGTKWKNPGARKEPRIGILATLARLSYFLLYFLYGVTIPFEYVAVTAVN